MAEQLASDGATELARQIPADRFEVISDPLGWRCRCGATVTGPIDAGPAGSGLMPTAIAARLAESAADHAMFCGRCDD